MASYGLPNEQENPIGKQKLSSASGMAGPIGTGQTGQMGVPAPMAQPGGTGPQPQGSGSGSGFANLQTVLDANGGGQQMADKLTVSGQHAAYDWAPSNAPPGMVQNTPTATDMNNRSWDKQSAQGASDYFKGLSGFGGISAALQGQYGKQQYSQGENTLDTLLTGNAGTAGFKKNADYYGGLSKSLGDPTYTAIPETKTATPKQTDIPNINVTSPGMGNTPNGPRVVAPKYLGPYINKTYGGGYY